MRYGTYLVLGTRRYRDHEPGTVFTERLDRGAEARAIQRGNIRFLHDWGPTIDRQNLTFPTGWLPREEQ